MCRTITPYLFIIVLFLSACEPDPEEGPVGPDGTVKFNVVNLPHLENGNYTLWLRNQREPVYIGSFNIDTTTGLPEPDHFKFNYQIINSSESAMITVEKQLAVDAPGKTVIASGKFGRIQFKENKKDTSILTIEGKHATLPGGFNIDNYYVLRTPTDSNEFNEVSGAWFVRLTGNDTLPGLTLFENGLNGWKYEAWVDFKNAGILSMGQFTEPDAPDESSKYSGPYEGFPYPGEDFLKNAPDTNYNFSDIRGNNLIITIEPSSIPQDEHPYMKIFEGEIPRNATPNYQYSLDYFYDSFPRPAISVIKFPPGEYDAE